MSLTGRFNDIISVLGKSIMIALVTGASRGIGKAIALALAQTHSASLFLVYQKNEVAAASVKESCEARGVNVMLHRADISVSAAAAGAVDACVTHYGRIDVLVNNAGITADSLSLTMADSEWLKVQDTNVNGAFYTSRAAAKAMMRKRFGRIINISSVSAKRPNRGQVNYAASKGALEALTRAMAVELASKKITVNAVAPGIIETDMSKRIRDAAGDEIRKSIPMGRFGQVEEVAGLVAFLAGPKSAYITGQVIGVDGGIGL
jgi:3-oxoacyl-[acyl-carrier protein] reductase